MNITACRSPSAIHAEKLLAAAQIWRGLNYELPAGLAMSAAIISSFKYGTLFFHMLPGWSRQAIEDYGHCIQRNPDDSLISILAFMKIYQELIRTSTTILSDSLDISRLRYSIMTNLADRLMSRFMTHPDGAKILLEGFRIEGSLTGNWTIVSSDDKYTYNHYDHENHTLSYRIDPAFDLLVATGDYVGANRICEYFPSASQGPGLKGWRAAVQALINPKEAHRLFFQAADWLEKDEPDADRIVRGMSEFANMQTWSTHFRTRGFLALATVDEDRFEHYILRAAQLASKHKVISIPEVKRFDFLIKTLAGLMEDAKGIAPSEARSFFLRNTLLTEEMHDSIILEFVDNAVLGLDELQKNRKHGLSRIGKAMSALDRLPLFGQSDTNTFTAALDRQALSVLDGQTSHWIHKSLSEIKNEDVLRKILLRLFQNQIPNYAQIRHGPIEYGKDIAVSILENDTNVLRMYQVKCGDINKDEWYRHCKSQLEEIYQIPMCDIQIPYQVDKRIGILIWNGHIGPYVEEVIQAWTREQTENFGRTYEFMNLDSIVNYIIDMRLVNALRASLKELGL